MSKNILLFVGKSVYEDSKNIILQSIRDNVITVFYEDKMIPEQIYSLTDKYVIDTVSFIYYNEYSRELPFFHDAGKFFGDSFKELVNYYSKKVESLTIDIITYDINEPEIIEEINAYENNTKCIIGYSTGLSGSPPVGNWIMEGGPNRKGVDIGDTYFTEIIKKWTGILAISSAPIITSITPGNQQLTIEFNNPSDKGDKTIKNYNYSTDGGINYVAIDPENISSPLIITRTSNDGKSLVNGTEYAIRIRAITSSGDGAQSNIMSATPSTIPSAPTITDITSGNQRLSIAFSAPSSDGGATITNYKYSTDSGVTYQLMTPVSILSPLVITQTSNNVPLINGTTYTIRIRAINSNGDGDESSSLVGIPSNVPSAPTITSITPGNQQLSIAFIAPSSNGGKAITNYKYSTDGGASYLSMNPTNISSPLVITQTSRNSPLVNGTSYTVRIRAVNSSGDGTVSGSVIATPSTVPSAPTITNIIPKNASADIFFTSPFNGGSSITNYKYSVNNLAFVSANTISSPITINGLTNGVSCAIKILAVNVKGDGVVSNTMSVIPGLPSAPTITNITEGNTNLSIEFTNPTYDGGLAITDYYYSINGNPFTSGNTATSPMTIPGLFNGTLYNIKIAAYNQNGIGAESNIKSGTPYTVPPPPVITALTVGSTSITVEFSAPNDGGSPITSYEYKITPANSWIPIPTPLNAPSPFVIQSLTNGVSYSVQMRATNKGGPSGSSNIMEATPYNAEGATLIYNQGTPSTDPLHYNDPSAVFGAIRMYSDSSGNAQTVVTNYKNNGGSFLSLMELFRIDLDKPYIYTTASSQQNFVNSLNVPYNKTLIPQGNNFYTSTYFKSIVAGTQDVDTMAICPLYTIEQQQTYDTIIVDTVASITYDVTTPAVFLVIPNGGKLVINYDSESLVLAKYNDNLYQISGSSAVMIDTSATTIFEIGLLTLTVKGIGSVGFDAIIEQPLCLHPDTIVDELNIPIKDVTSYTDDFIKNIKSKKTNKFIKITKNSLGSNTPNKDILMTPGHPIICNGIEIEAGCLVNGTTIHEVVLDEPVSVYTLAFTTRKAVKMHNLDVMNWDYNDYLKFVGQVDSDL